MFQKGYPFWIFSKAISRRVIKVPAYNGGVLNRHRSRATVYLNSRFTCQQVRYSTSLWRNGYSFINGYDLFYNGRNSPESLQAYDPTLGGYILKLRLQQICKFHVTASMHHGTWGLMQGHFFTCLIEDPTHPIGMSLPLGATNFSCQKFKVHKP